MRKRAKKPEILSPQGVRSIKIVAGARLLTLLALAAILIVSSQLLGAYLVAPPPPALSSLQIAILAGALIILTLAAYGEKYYGGRAALDEEKRLRRKCLQQLFRLGRALRQEDRLDSGRLVELFTDNIERTTLFRNTYSGSSLAAVAMPVFVALYLLVAVDWVVGLGLLLLYPLIPVGVAGFMKLFAGSSADSRRQRARLSSRYLDAIQNLVTIRLLGAGERIEKELNVQGEKNRRAIMRLLAGNQIVIIVLDGLFSLLLVVGAFLLALWRYQSGALTPAGGLQVVFLSILLLEPLQQLAGFFYVGMGGMASQKALRRFLELKRAGVNDPEAHPFTQPEQVVPGYVRAGARFKVERDGQLASTFAEEGNPIRYYLRDVHFDYGRGEVLRGVDLQVKRGERVAIVGASGGGKTTLLGLLRGELLPTSGVLALDGIESLAAAGAGLGLGAGVGGPLAESEARPFSTQLAYVAQNTWLFTGTIRDNLLLAQPDAQSEDLWAALEKANLAAEVRAMPEGLDTHIGEQGSLISGGQAQRLSLARAFLSQRDLLLFDEPTAQVDIASQAKLIDAISKIERDTTLVFVTHRLELLALADRVFRVEDGLLCSRGKPRRPELDQN